MAAEHDGSFREAFDRWAELHTGNEWRAIR